MKQADKVPSHMDGDAGTITGYSSEGMEQAGSVLNPFGKLLKIITAPSEAAASIARKPDVLLPIGLLLVTPILPILTNFQAYKDTLVTTLAMNPALQGQSAEELQSVANISALTGLAVAPVTVIIAWLIGALVLFGIVKMFKGECQYKQILSLSGYTTVFGLLGGMLTALVSRFSGAAYAQTNLTSLATLLPNLQIGFLSGVAGSIEVFGIWALVATWIGLSVIAGLDRKKSAIIVGSLFVLQLLFVGVVTQLGAAASALGG